MGLHLGWIPNEPGLRPRVYDQAAPAEPEPDPAKVAALKAVQHARGIWGRLLIVTGLSGLVLFGVIGAFGHLAWAWAAAAVIAACCWWPVIQLSLAKRRAAARLRRETQRQFERHAAEVEQYEKGKEQWARSEAERIASEPRWLQVSAHEDLARLDVFGGTPLGRQSLLTGVGQTLLAERAVVVLDLSQDRVAGELVAVAGRAGISCQDYELPRDLTATPLLDGLAADEIASLIVEVTHADAAGATAAGRATDLMILKKLNRVLGEKVTMGRLHAALSELLADGGAADGGAADGGVADGNGDPRGPGGRARDEACGHVLTCDERAGLRAAFGGGMRHQVAANLVRLAAVIEPLTALGADAASRPPARLTCLSLPDGPRDVTADLTAALVVQWITHAVATGGGFRPAIVLAGGDEQSARHLGRLVAVCERHEVPLVRMFSRLTEESARHLDTRHTAFLRLATRPEALRAAEHIGLERRFVAGRFSRRHDVSRSRTRTTSESVTHTTGHTEGEAVTHTTGTTTGQSYAEAEVPRRDTSVHVHLGDRADGDGASRRGRDRLEPEPEQGTGSKDAGTVKDAVKEDKAGQRTADPRPRDRGGSGWGSGGKRQSGAGARGKPEVDLVKTRTWFTARHESEATTKSWANTEETSHTRSTSRSRTDGVSVGDEISFELVYDHKVAPETLMALPEDQMLAPHITEASAGPGKTLAEGKMVALVIDSAVVGTEAVAPVRPDQIPAFEPPAPAISAHVPDYERVPRPVLEPGTARDRGA